MQSFVGVGVGVGEGSGERSGEESVECGGRVQIIDDLYSSSQYLVQSMNRLGQSFTSHLSTSSYKNSQF